MTSGPVVAQVLEGENAVARNRDIMGATDPEEGRAGTIRADLAESIEANVVHGSDAAPIRPPREIGFFFSSRPSSCPALRPAHDQPAIQSGLRARPSPAAEPDADAERVNLLGLPRAELEALCVDARAAGRFAARQLHDWLYKRGCDRFEDMTDLAQGFSRASSPSGPRCGCRRS